MSYSKEVVAAVAQDFEKKRALSEENRLIALSKAYRACPEIKRIDEQLKGTTREIISAISLGRDGYSEKIKEIREKNLALQKEREALLIKSGLGADFTDLRFECDRCEDTGYIDGFICDCHRRALTLKSYELSGIGSLMQAQSFGSFSLDFYSGEDKALMEQNLAYLVDYAKNFSINSDSLLLYGGTGLGKTHLSTAVAKAVIDKGYYVVYESAQNIFSDFDNDRFRDRFNGDEPVAGKYLECELLIIDDLGTEIISQFTVSCLYNIVNTRLNRGLPTIINTNLLSAELLKLYQERITSRLFGEFNILHFKGSDIRRQRLKRR